MDTRYVVFPGGIFRRQVLYHTVYQIVEHRFGEQLMKYKGTTHILLSTLCHPTDTLSYRVPKDATIFTLKELEEWIENTWHCL